MADGPSAMPMSPADFNPEVGLSEADMEKQCKFKQEAVEALEDGKNDLALEKFNEAIKLGTDSALLYSRRAQVLLKMDNIEACINDCDAALKLNPDSAKGYKIRARAYIKQRAWVKAHQDFATGQKLDFDDDTDEFVKNDCRVDMSDGKGGVSLEEYVKQMQGDEGKARAEKEKEEYYRAMEENKRKYEEGLKARDGEMREKRMAEEAEKEKKKEGVRERARAREAEEKKQQEEAEEEEVPTGEAPDQKANEGGSKAEDCD